MYVVGCSGQAQMGKDTLADRLKDRLNDSTDMVWTRSAFAGNVKKVYCETFDVDLAFVEEWKVKPEVPPGFDMPVRQALQFIGDGFRKIRSTIWLDLAFRDKNSPTIISDVRYVNEFLRVKQEGGLNILIGRPDKLNDDSNGSEAQIKPYIEWCLKYFNGNKFWDLRSYWLHGFHRDNNPPEHIEAFDVFVRNDGTKEELYELIDRELVWFVKRFEFKGNV